MSISLYPFGGIVRQTPDGADALTLAEHGRAAGNTRGAMAQAIDLRRRAGRLSAEPRADLLRDGFTLGELLVWYAAAMAEAEACAPHTARGEEGEARPGPTNTPEAA